MTARRPASLAETMPYDRASTATGALTATIGEPFGPYMVYEKLGEGGMACVHRAELVGEGGLRKPVALKRLHTQTAEDPDFVEAFVHEAQLAAKLQHPNVVDIYDIQTRSGLLWYTMELVGGPNLAQLVQREGPLSVPRVIRLLREALSALAQAHALGLVHRDIKPENMLIAPGGGLKITDFGLALALRGGRFGGATSQSGTPQFASPEQLLGEKVDQRSDLYSLSAVAYFALLGRPPFEGGTPEQILARQATDQAPDLRTAVPDVGPGLANVLQRALQSTVDRRYATANDFLQALNRVTRRGRLERGLDLLRWRLGSLWPGSS